MTDIQLAAVPHALAGRDVLGAAKTGSGKTLAFVVPLLEKLYREGWSLSDGLGALIITPTRELALQIFEVLRLVGKGHMFSAALLTGGKKEFREEQRRVPRMNIIVATPGRLLQHLEETPGFDASQLQVLVLDEADRILDMGFSAQLNAILDYLPQGGDRQTLLFSATQTKSVKDLARLSLGEAPQYVGVHDKSEHATPDQLVQNYVVSPLEEKLDMLWSFLKSHMKHKVVVFLSSCSQVRYVYECFRCMQPGVPLLALHGKIKQARRTHIYFDFVRRPAAVLFATDIAARGLDFPACDWVVQVDAPEDAAMYIHRVGRTARYQSGGRSLLFLCPSEEEGMLKRLQMANVPIKRLTVNPSKTTSVKQKTAAVVASNMECKRLASKAFSSYLRSVALMPHKDIFNVSKLDLDAFADSLGLPKCPSTKFLKLLKEEEGGEGGGEGGREGVRAKKNKSRALERLKEKIKMERAEKAGGRRREEEDRKGGRKGGSESESEEEGSSSDEEGSEDEEEEEEGGLLRVKQKHAWDQEKEEEEDAAVAAALAAKAAKKKLKEKMKLPPVGKPVGQNKKIVFASDSEEEEGEEEEVGQQQEKEEEEEGGEEGGEDMLTLKAKNEAYVQAVQMRLQASREEDRAAERERVREKHKKKRLRDKGERDEEDEEGMEGGAVLGSYEEEESGEEESGEEESDDEEENDEGSEEEDEEEELVHQKAKRSKPLSLQEQEEAVLRSLRGGAA
jgi:ATP-dependent RNA helicase DDX10/DBP4